MVMNESGSKHESSVSSSQEPKDQEKITHTEMDSEPVESSAFESPGPSDSPESVISSEDPEQIPRTRPRVLPMAGQQTRSTSPLSSKRDNLGAKRMSLGWFIQQPITTTQSSSGQQKGEDRTTMIHRDYIMRRIQQNSQKAGPDGEKRESSIRELQRTFSGSRGHHRTMSDADWDFWTQVVQDYPQVAAEYPQKLKNAIVSGFPASLRPVLWQIISGSRNPDLEEVYLTLSQEQDVHHSKAIAKDLDRTSLVKNIDAQALARILKAYSLFDPEVGYTQGMAFIAVPLLFDIPESDVFCLFVQLMKAYDFRSLFLPEMPGLHVKLYQFERLVEDRLEKVHIHLKRQGVLSSMYASQWFLTVFAYKFPLQLIERIFDVVIAEGYETVLRFALVLMQQNVDRILELKFDDLLPFLKDNIFDTYTSRPGELVKDASLIDITPQILAQYELEYQEIQRHERERAEQMDSLRTSNSKLTFQVRQLEVELAALNQEHVEIANKMVETGLENARLSHEVEELRIENKHMKASVDEDALEVIKERDQLREVRERLEAQIEGLQTALSAALTE